MVNNIMYVDEKQEKKRNSLHLMLFFFAFSPIVFLVLIVKKQ